MSSITLHGAVEEIGGNKILIEDGATKLFFDFGLSFGKYGNYFSPYLQPRRYSIISDYMNLGLYQTLLVFTDKTMKRDLEKLVLNQNMME